VRRPLPDALFRRNRPYVTVYMDSHDGHRTVSWEPEYRQFDLILRSKLNRRAWYPPNMQPWVLGFTKRVLDAASGGPSFGARQPKISINFGASHPFFHGTRKLAAATFEPRIGAILEIDRSRDNLVEEPEDSYEALMWRQSGGRFSRAYYERLKRTQAVACFCGELIPPMPRRSPERYLVGGKKAKLRRAFFDALALIDPRPSRLVQWDSFRFWETLVAGCVAFNLDLEKHGVMLPVMPENWKHYIGVDFRNVDDAIDRITSDSGCLERIAGAGRQWALEHYSPKRMAERLLAMTGFSLDRAAAA
jgi:hypothetical protein